MTQANHQLEKQLLNPYTIFVRLSPHWILSVTRDPKLCLTGVISDDSEPITMIIVGVVRFAAETVLELSPSFVPNVFVDGDRQAIWPVRRRPENSSRVP